MPTTMEDVQKWATANGHDGKAMSPVTKDDLRSWAKDFYQEISTPDAGSFRDRFERTISKQKNDYFQVMLRGVLEVMSLGYPLSKAMSLHPDAFDEKFITIVKYGEMHGEVDLTLQRYLEKPEDMEPRCGVRQK